MTSGRYRRRQRRRHLLKRACVPSAVCAIDPLLIMEPERLVTAAASSSSDAQAVQPYVTVSVPFRLLARLNAGRLVLAEHDDPGGCEAGWQQDTSTMWRPLLVKTGGPAAASLSKPAITSFDASILPAGNSWHFGEEGELFQYKFAGRHAVHSGFTSLVLAHELQGKAPPSQQTHGCRCVHLTSCDDSYARLLYPAPSWCLPLLICPFALFLACSAARGAAAQAQPQAGRGRPGGALLAGLSAARPGQQRRGPVAHSIAAGHSVCR